MGKGKKQLKRARRTQQQQREKEKDGEEHGEEAELESLGFDDALAAGMAFEQLGATEAAVEAFEVARKRRPSHLEALTRLADALSASGERERAIAIYREASELPDGSRDASVWFRLGLALAALDKDSDAVESYTKAIELGRQRVEEGAEGAVKAYCVTLAALANCFGEQGDLDAAVRVFRDATALLPDNGNLHYNLANMLMARAGRAFDEEVVTALERAIECSPDSVDFCSELIEYLTQHKQQSGKVKVLREKISEMEAAAEKEGAGRKKRKRASGESKQGEEEEEEEEEEEDDDGDDDDDDDDDGSDDESASDSQEKAEESDE